MKPNAKKDDPIPNLCVFNGAMRNVIVSLKYRYVAMEEQEIIGPELKIKIMMEACVEVKKLVISLAIRNFLVTLKLFLNAKSSLFL